MIRTVLHGADFHLDSPFSGLSPEQAARRRQEQRGLLDRLVTLANEGKADVVLLSGDLLDGDDLYRETAQTLARTLGNILCPVMIAAGNHDYLRGGRGYDLIQWPENVHIFKEAKISSLALPELDCRIYGAGYESMDCPGLLKDFLLAGTERWQIGLLHGEISAASEFKTQPVRKYSLLPGLSPWGGGTHPVFR